MQKLADLFTVEQLKAFGDAPLMLGFRHPTWFPLFYEKPRPVDFLVNAAVGNISGRPGGDSWLKDLIPRLANLDSIDDPASALAEIRAYGALMAAGFVVTPIARDKDDTTPDFLADADDGDVVIEVCAKHQDNQETELQRAVHDPNAELPPGVTRRTETTDRGSITMTMFEMMPAGKPDPNKPNDSVQANMVSRVCAIKQKEAQLPSDKPSVLVMDFANFGGPHAASMISPSEAEPVATGHYGICCGPFWYAMYGWKDAPLFDEMSRRIIKMGHEGRFRQKTKLSAVLIVLMNAVVLLENPWATYRLPERARLSLCRYPWFKLVHSIADWQPGLAEEQVAIDRRLIETMETNFLSFWCDP
jgi:hypothetical protein